MQSEKEEDTLMVEKALSNTPVVPNKAWNDAWDVAAKPFCDPVKPEVRRCEMSVALQTAVDVKEVMEVLPKMLPMRAGHCETMIWDEEYQDNELTVKEPLKQAAWTIIDNWISDVTRGPRVVAGEASTPQLRWWYLRCRPVASYLPLWEVTPATIKELTQVATVATYGDQRTLETKTDASVRLARDILLSDALEDIDNHDNGEKKGVCGGLLDWLASQWAVKGMLPSKVRVEPYKVWCCLVCIARVVRISAKRGVNM